CGGVGVPGSKKLSGAIVKLGDDACGRRTVRMHVPDGQEDTDARPGAAGVLFVSDDDDAAVGGRHNCRWILWDNALRVAEERKTEKPKGDQSRSQDPPVKQDGESAEKNRWDAEIIAFLDHELMKIP